MEEYKWYTIHIATRTETIDTEVCEKTMTKALEPFEDMLEDAINLKILRKQESVGVTAGEPVVTPTLKTVKYEPNCLPYPNLVEV